MDKREKKIGDAGAPSHTQGFHELKAEHMARTNGVIPPGSVPPPDAEEQHHRPHKDEKEKP
ncbi:MAG: hypothetical protein QOF02_1501 [Blastocatellia bacterium]|jgi:hypothetical protein|nr:hypothetical protein [Blastocatellia bacterium]